jgi:hypothetical protein
LSLPAKDLFITIPLSASLRMSACLFYKRIFLLVPFKVYIKYSRYNVRRDLNVGFSGNIKNHLNEINISFSFSVVST